MVWFEYKIYSGLFVLNDGTFKYFLIYLTFSFFGLILSPIFYTFHLFDLIDRFPTLGNVVRAVTMNFK